MEVVGARFGRSSTRYNTTSSSSTVFNGPVRKWEKKWIHSSSPSPNSVTTHNTRSTNGNNGSHLLLYKWAPISQNQNNNNNDNSAKDEAAAAANAASTELPRRKLKYIPIAVLEEQRNEAEKVDDEAKPTDGPIYKNDGLDGKPDINDVLMEEHQAPNDTPSLTRQDLNESTLDLSLG